MNVAMMLRKLRNGLKEAIKEAERYGIPEDVDGDPEEHAKEREKRLAPLRALLADPEMYLEASVGQVWRARGGKNTRLVRIMETRNGFVSIQTVDGQGIDGIAPIRKIHKDNFYRRFSREER